MFSKLQQSEIQNFNKPQVSQKLFESKNKQIYILIEQNMQYQKKTKKHVENFILFQNHI